MIGVLWGVVLWMCMRVVGMLGVLCGFVLWMCMRASSCLCVAAASVELYLIGCSCCPKNKPTDITCLSG